MTQVGYSTRPKGITYARRVESYDPSIGCLAIRLNEWVVVMPDGSILARFGDNEYEARNQAQYVNLTCDIKSMYR